MYTRKKSLSDDSWVRRNLAILITIISVLGIMILTGIAIYFIFNKMLPALTAPNNSPKEAFSMLQTVLGFILPLIGTWMGTILAFYFSKESYEAASKSVNEIFSSVVNSSAVGNNVPNSKNAYEVSKKFEEIISNATITGKSDDKINVIEDIYTFLQKTNKGDRLPVFNNDNVVRYVIHLSTINDFLTQFENKKFPDLVDLKKENISLADMINKSSNAISDLITNSVGFVSKTSTLSDVQTLIKNNKQSQDVFVTLNGKKDEPVLGWITNNRLIDLTKA